MTSRLTFLGGVGVTLAAATLLSGRPAKSDSFAKPTGAVAAMSPLAMTTSHTCDGVRDLMIDTVVAQMIGGGGYYGGYYNGYYGGYYGGGAMPPTAAPAVADEASRAPSVAPAPAATPVPMPVQQSAPGPSHYTTTNTHERGVDEADIVKTDGKFVYTLHGMDLVIAKTWPVAETKVASRFTFKTVQPQQMYLRGNQIVISGYATNNDGQTNTWPEGRTRVVVLDVSNRSAPKLSKIVDVGGWSTSSRVIGGELFLVQNTAMQIPPKLYEQAQKIMANVPRADQQSLRPWEIQSRLAAMLRGKLTGSVSQSDITAALPKISSGGQLQRMACDDLYVPPNNTQLGITTLARVSLDADRSDLVGAMVQGGQIYASTDALYVTAPFYSWNNYGYGDYGTQVHQFSLGDDNTRPAYVASGKVPGMLLNEFSMSEWNGDLRIATTDWNWNGQQGGNDLFVLRPTGHELRTIGAIRGIAKGERIYAGRLVGDKGYLVTFRQTDPLFTLDLSDPTNPRIAGKLEINGFSSYIHPIGNDQLLTIGQDADDNGRVKGLQLQVFDVKDPDHPRRAFRTKVATSDTYTWSNAQNDHHAFTFDPVTGTLAFPLSESANNHWFNGLAVYHLGKNGFQPLGRIDHAGLADVAFDANCKRMKREQPQYAASYCSDTYREQSRYGIPVDRSMIVDKYILSMSSLGLEIHELGDLDLATSLSWDKVNETSAIAQ